MNVGLLTLELHLPASVSLKDKRKVLQSLQNRLRSRFNVAVAEVGHQELWQRASVAVVSVAAHRQLLDQLFDSVVSDAEKIVPGDILSAEREILG
jgi:uncharacterized protein